MSSEFSQARMSPVACEKPLFSASACPLSFSDTHQAKCCWYFLMISTLSSFEPPSTTMYSMLGYVCASTDRIDASRKWPWLYDGVMMETLAFAGRVVMGAEDYSMADSLI